MNHVDISSEGLTRTTSQLPVVPSKDYDSKQPLNTKKSSRKLTRPAPTSNNDAGISRIQDMKTTGPQATTIQPRKSSTSLFNLFSKPKVEKARGYAGEGPVRASLPVKTTPKPASPPPSHQPRRQESVRAESALSLRPVEYTPPSIPQDHSSRPQIKTTSWTAPPLFQAFARSVKHGLAEVATNAVAEKSTPTRPKTAKDKDRTSVDSELSEDTKQTRVTAKGNGNTLSTHVEAPQKIIVLLDTGHILQYSQHGPTNRLPEKVLALGLDSAAMTCDVAASKNPGLRIIQSVAQKSFSLASTFSRLTRRSARRDTSSLLLLFNEAHEVDDWLSAVRYKIQELCQPQSTTPTKEQSKVDSVIGEMNRLSGASMPSPPQPQEEPRKKVISIPPPLSMLPTVPERRTSLMPLSPPPMSITFDDDSDDEDRKGSLEVLEEEAEKLISTRPTETAKRISDAPSFASSITASMDQRNSARMSHISNGTGLTSRTSSLTSEPSENVVEKPYRTLSSYQTTKRRSVLPLAKTEAPASLLGQVASSVESPVIGTPLSAMPETKPQHPKDNTPPIVEEDERPQSILTDLPPPSTWSSKIPPKNRNSLTPTDRQLHRMSSAPSLQTSAPQITSRRASQAFRIPLKINPNTPTTEPARNRNRNTFSPDASTGEPKIFTLEAKIDPRHQRMSMSPSMYSDIRSRSAQRLSLFPSPLMTQNTFPEEHRPLGSHHPGADAVPPRRASLQRPTSLQVRTDRAPFLSSVRTSPPTDVVTAAPPIRSLKPSRSSSAIASMQTVREMGRSASPTDPFQSGRAPDDMRRRMSYMSKRSPSPASAPPHAPLPAAPMGNSFAQRSYQRHSYMPRSSMMGLPTLDLGIPTVGLGPPAPPPDTPLPLPPGGAPPGITMPIPMNRTSINSMMRARTPSLSAQANGLGIQVG